MSVEPRPVAPLDDTGTLRNQLRALGGMVLTLATAVEALATRDATRADGGYDDSALQLQLTEIRKEVDSINATIGD